MTASIPVWVPVVFLALVFLGYRQSFARTVRPNTVASMALGMLAFSLYGVIAAFGPVGFALGLWVAGYAGAAFMGSRMVASERMAMVGTSVHIPGSWVPLALLLSIFAAKFALGFAAGVQSPVLQSAGFVAAMSAVLGALSGGFGARALAVHRVAKSAAPPAGAVAA